MAYGRAYNMDNTIHRMIMMKNINIKHMLIMIIIVLMLSLSVSSFEDIKYASSDEFEVESSAFMIFNATIEQYQNVTIGFEKQDSKKIILCFSNYSESVTDVIFRNQICEVQINETGLYYTFSELDGEREYGKHISIVDKKLKVLNIILFITGLIICIYGLFNISYLTMIGFLFISISIILSAIDYKYMLGENTISFILLGVFICIGIVSSLLYKH